MGVAKAKRQRVKAEMLFTLSFFMSKKLNRTFVISVIFCYNIGAKEIDRTRRIAEIDKLIKKVFEQNASGILSDERFAKMLQSYEKEQKALTQEVSDSQQTLQDAKQRVTDLRLLLRTLREMTDITELTPTLVNSLIERIEVHNNDKSSGHCYVKVDIYFTAAGMIDIPTEQEILAMMEEIRENPQDFRFVA